jgi:hypothetical protein
MRDYKKYDVWRKAHDFTLFIYKEIISEFPKSESRVFNIKRPAFALSIK